tara:strand:+ start:89 stop:1117 length:1029 start_codon:yes stop_codon:yes gene_type:complete
MEYPSLGTPPAGSLRFNTDSNKMEIYNGDAWWNIDSTSPQEQTGGTRGFVAGGYQSPAEINNIDMIDVDSTGSGTDFGNLTESSRLGGLGASRTRAVRMGGISPGNPNGINTIDYWTMASTGDAVNFGDLVSSVRSTCGLSNSTRALATGGTTAGNAMEYVTIASTGNAVDFGDKYVNATQAAGTASPTRGLLAGGETPTRVNTIQYITMSTLGNSADFGDITRSISGISANGNAVRCIFGAGEFPSSFDATMDYVTISTLGNALNFGELTFSFRLAGTASSPTRGVWMGGTNDDPASNTVYNTIQYVQTMSTGNAIDFGDLSTTFGYTHIGSCSNGHGGLG